MLLGAARSATFKRCLSLASLRSTSRRLRASFGVLQGEKRGRLWVSNCAPWSPNDHCYNTHNFEAPALASDDLRSFSSFSSSLSALVRQPRTRAPACNNRVRNWISQPCTAHLPLGTFYIHLLQQCFVFWRRHALLVRTWHPAAACCRPPHPCPSPLNFDAHTQEATITSIYPGVKLLLLSIG